MSAYKVIAERSGRIIKQKFYVRIVASNGETLFHSEMYKNKDYAKALAQTWAGYCDGNFIDAT